MRKRSSCASTRNFSRSKSCRPNWIDTLARLDLAYPKVDQAKLKELAAAKRALLAKK